MSYPRYATDPDTPLTPLDYLTLRRCDRANALGIYPSKKRLARPLPHSMIRRSFTWQVERLCRRDLLGQLVLTGDGPRVFPFSRYPQGPPPDPMSLIVGGKRWRLALTDAGTSVLAELSPARLAEIDGHLPEHELRDLQLRPPAPAEHFAEHGRASDADEIEFGL